MAPNPIVELKASYRLGASAGVWEDETVNAGHGGHKDNDMGVRLADRDSAYNGCVLQAVTNPAPGQHHVQGGLLQLQHVSTCSPEDTMQMPKQPG